LSLFSLLYFLYNIFIICYSRQREAVQDLAPMLWHSFGSIAALLQEVISVYPAINPPTLTVTHTYNNNNNKKTLQVFLY
jgi:CCR4-NOT transcription complex subunit 9